MFCRCRTQGREELRRQLGTLRFDINVVADTLPKAAKKDVLAAKNEFLAAVDKLDFAMRKKNQADADKALAAAKSKLDVVIAKLA
jgi:photosystem II oxygen-evolving enhancer protein 3